MALSTGYNNMFACQQETGILMIERRGRPAAGCVTVRALYAKFAIMRIVFGMA